MCTESGLQTAPNWPKIRKMTMTSQFSDMKPSSNFLDVVLFLWSALVTGSSFMSMLTLVLELWQFYFIRNWAEIRKSEIPPSGFCPISGEAGEGGDTKLWIPNLGRMSLIEYYWMLKHSRGYSFYRFWVVKGKPTCGVKIPPTPSTPPR